MRKPLEVREYIKADRLKKKADALLAKWRPKALPYLQEWDYNGIKYRQDNRLKLDDNKVLAWILSRIPPEDIDLVTDRKINYEKLDTYARLHDMSTEDLNSDCYTLTKVDIITVEKTK